KIVLILRRACGIIFRAGESKDNNEDYAAASYKIPCPARDKCSSRRSLGRICVRRCGARSRLFCASPYVSAVMPADRTIVPTAVFEPLAGLDFVAKDLVLQFVFHIRCRGVSK